MSNYSDCPRCRELVWKDEACFCKLFTYRIESQTDEDDWTHAYWRAKDCEYAAELIVEADWNYEPGDPSDVDETVAFKDESGRITRFNVTAEPRVDFNAEELTP